MTTPGDPYADPDALQDAVGRLTDPLNDPLPSTGPRHAGGPSHGGSAPHGGGQNGGGQHGALNGGGRGAGSPWFRPHHPRAAGAGEPVPQQPAPADPARSYDAYPGGAYAADPYAGGPGRAGGHPAGEAGRAADQAYALLDQPVDPADAVLSTGPGDLSADLPADDETMALRQAKEPGKPERSAAAVPPPGEGRAARRKAAKAGRRKPSWARDGEPAGGPAAASAAEEAERQAEGGRAARRRAAKKRKDGFGVLASRAIGELFITTGVLLLLFVTYQLWWTNVQANQHARGEANNLERSFEEENAKQPEAFEPGEGFAIMYIPKLDVRVPVAEGIDKNKVLDRGMAGHYDKASGLDTAMPWDRTGNFAVAGHRNTHGEPFRYINRLDPGDEIIVETGTTYYTYEVANTLPSTTPGNVDVVRPVPQQSGFTKPGRYLTLTTCTPEFSSKYRLIVWGTMVDERPRSDGKPDALGG